MTAAMDIRIGTSGYSFPDWVGPFYPPRTRSREMFAFYQHCFPTVELNFSYYRLPTPKTMASLASAAPEGFTFWVKANQETTHKQNRAAAGPFLDGVQPMVDAGKLAGVLLQFPQSFRRSVANRRYLARAVDDLAPLPLAVEFRHRSWRHPDTNRGLAGRAVTLVIPDVPAIEQLYSSPPAVTGRVGYLRLHSRKAENWYAGAVERYDYTYSDTELADLARQWRTMEGRIDKLFVFFNNCHHAQAAQNARDFARIVQQIIATPAGPLANLDRKPPPG